MSLTRFPRGVDWLRGDFRLRRRIKHDVRDGDRVVVVNVVVGCEAADVELLKGDETLGGLVDIQTTLRTVEVEAGRAGGSKREAETLRLTSGLS